MEMNNIPRELFVNISERGFDWGPIVCLEHKRVVPCRECMYGVVTTIPYSDKVEDYNAIDKHWEKYFSEQALDGEQ